MEFDGLNREITIDPTSLKVAGDYEYNVLMRPMDPNIGVSDSFNFKLRLINECDKA